MYLEQQIEILTQRLIAVEKAMSVQPIANDQLADDLRDTVYRVGNAFSVHPSAILRKGRMKRYAQARQVVYYIAHERLGYSFHEIGNALKMDHSGIQYGVERVKDRMSIDHAFRKKVQDLSHEEEVAHA